jgi:signal peptidase I
VLESVVQGISMGRTLAPGSTIRIELAERPTYRVGDVVAFLAGRRLIVHRLVYRGNSRMARGFLLTRGDANLIPDAPVPEANVLGPVIAVRSDADWLTLYGRPRSSPARVTSAFFLLVVIVALRINPKYASICVGLLRRCETGLRSKLRKSWMRQQSSSGHGV